MLNKFIGIGNFGSDPEVRYTPSGKAVCSLSMACNETYKDKDGVKHQNTEWLRLVFWGRLAEIVGEYTAKGSKVYVEGKVRTRSWEDKNTGQTKYMTEIVCNQMLMLDSQKRERSTPSATLSGDIPDQMPHSDDIFPTTPEDDDIPF